MIDKEHKTCLVCGGVKLKPLMKKNGADLLICGDCRFVFFRQIPTPEELENYYKGYGRNDYLSPITIKRYHEILDRFEPYRKNNRLIDVGCGIGYFLEEAKKRGWEVYGTEYTDKAIAICQYKGINMSKGALDPKNYEPGFFDVVTSFEVMEHINNPREEVKCFNEILRSGGALYITTPNYNSLSRLQLGGDWTVILYPEHLSYYTPSTLTYLLAGAGFSPVRVETTGISITRFKRAKKISDQPLISASSDDEKLRTAMEGNRWLASLKQGVNGLLTLAGRGDSLKGLYQRN